MIFLNFTPPSYDRNIDKPHPPPKHISPARDNDQISSTALIANTPPMNNDCFRFVCVFKAMEPTMIPTTEMNIASEF